MSIDSQFNARWGLPKKGSLRLTDNVLASHDWIATFACTLRLVDGYRGVLAVTRFQLKGSRRQPEDLEGRAIVVVC